MKRALIAGMLALSVWGPALAKPDVPREVRQTNFNATLVVSDASELSGRLNGLMQRHRGTVQSFNSDASNTSASASLQVPPAELDEVLAELPKLGRIENQSLSSSDYTQSYRDAANRLRVYEALANVPIERIVAGSGLSPQDQSLARAELQQMIRERASSYQSSMQSYLDYNNRAQISLQFRFADPGATPAVEPTPGPVSAPPPPPAGPVNQGTLLPLYLLGFVNLTFLWLLARRSPTPATPAAPPGTHD